MDRLVTRPGRLVTILSNSKSNGAEVNVKCAEICQKFEKAFEQQDLSIDDRFETMHYETRVTVHNKVGRIKILAANPKTARGFSGDLLLDEFAFHENSAGIWEAAEPILSAHPDYLCRIASTPNGRHNMFYRLVTGRTIPVRKVPRSEAWIQGLEIFHPITREKITPEQARDLASDKRAYDQNYECAFEVENMALLHHDLISAAENATVGFVCEENWTQQAIDAMSIADRRLPADERSRRAELARERGRPLADADFIYAEDGTRYSRSESHPDSDSEYNRHLPMGNAKTGLFAGVDVGRYHDQTVITVVEKSGSSFLVRAILRMRGMRLPQQQERLAVICRISGLNAVMIDMTGLGLGLYEYAWEQFGPKIKGLNFSSSIPLNTKNNQSGERTRVPEALATQLLQIFEDRRIQHPIDAVLREDLRKPERIVSPGGRVSIAASRDANGHADHFWSLALAVHAASTPPMGDIEVIRSPKRMFIPRTYFI